MICNNCGKEIEDDSEFCYFCGSDTVNTDQVEFEEVGLFDKEGNSEEGYGEIANNLRNLMFANIDTEAKVSGMKGSVSGDEYNLASMSNLTGMRCHLCGSKVISGEIIADQGRDVFDMFADGTCFCPKCRVVTGFFKAN